MEGQDQSGQLRWRLVEHEESAMLFSESALGERHVGTGEYRGMEFFHVNARTIVNKVPSASRMPFDYTINAYRGCSHACTYCFARPTHSYLGLGTGEDFERKIVVKVNAVERLRAELRSPKWRGDHIAMGTNTDPYQKAEGKYHLTQGIVRVLAEAGNSFSILTKSTLVLRDISLLSEAATRTRVSLALSIGTLDREVWRLTEPGTPPPDKRLEAVTKLNEAGVRCGVLIAPVLPGLSDSEEQLRAVTKACLEAGAVSITPVALHLRPGVREHYLEWLSGARPELVALHAERFKRGSYQPRAEQQRISEIVRSVERPASRRSAWRGVEPRALESADGPGAAEPSRPAPSAPALDRRRGRVEALQLRPSPEQLRLL
ncbi:MAG: radical SAM protein [Acidimicrobiales bacterium]